jgi:GTP-binding protein of the ras superfamily involved in termination of M-phase
MTPMSTGGDASQNDDDPLEDAPAPSKDLGAERKRVTVKVGLVGDAQVGKTSLMQKYGEGNFHEDYVATLGTNFMERTISIKKTDITLSLWDLGGAQEYLYMLDQVCNDAVALFFVFDLSRPTTLDSIKAWYSQARRLNKTAHPFLIGTKYDALVELPADRRRHIEDQARKFAGAMRGPLVFTSAARAINVQQTFAIVLWKVFDVKIKVKRRSDVGSPIVEY